VRLFVSPFCFGQCGKSVYKKNFYIHFGQLLFRVD